MRKNLLLLFALSLLPFVMGAWNQFSDYKVNELLQQAPSYSQNATFGFRAPALIDLPENQKILGHYDSDDVLTGGGYGLSSKTGVIPVGVILDYNEVEMFQGGKIVAFRVGLSESTPVTRVFVIPISATGTKGEATGWECNVNNVGWNVVEVETPYEINIEENGQLMIGFDYLQTVDNHPLSAVKFGNPYDAYYYSKVTGFMYQWRPMGLTSYGNLSVQCIVEKEDFPDYLLEISDLVAPDYVKVGEDMEYSFSIRNNGSKRIDPEAVVANVYIDGEQVSTISNPMVIANGYYTISGSINVSEMESGKHSLSVVLATLYGEEITEPQSLQKNFNVFYNIFPRQKHLVEQLTSTYCTYCPLGNSMLSILTAQRDDVIWVGLHGNLGSGKDPFRSAQSDSLLSLLTGGEVAYPSAAFNRSTGWEDDVNIVTGIGYYAQYHQMVADELGLFLDEIAENVPNFATIEGECIIPGDGNAMVKIYGEITRDFDAMMGTDAKLNVYLVEDNLVARQLNSGTWEEEYVHNGVFRCALGTVRGVSLNKTSESTYENTFNFTIPDNYDVNNLHIVAFISRPLMNAVHGFTDLYVVNAERFDFSITEGIEELRTDEELTPVYFYDVTGRQHEGLQQGINIIKMSDGSVRKVLVK